MKKNHEKKEVLLLEDQYKLNPWLKRRWWTRMFFFAIVTGASVPPSHWRTIRFVIYFGPFVILAAFGSQFYFGDDDWFSWAAVCFAIFGAPILWFSAYGYHNRDRINVSRLPDINWASHKRFTWLYAYIGVAVSTGTGFFAWFKD